ncbi:MAG: glycosyltransferase [Deltaproteobacteria bacterium]|nr:glycosyltransferase [Deltaproteobacteria bacterium]MBI3388517.1 glycosyltransferase [Deltaproteobacteria bacterium]
MQFHLLSFEGPDGYSRAGGIASRITGLSQALAEAGDETHLWFVGDPTLPGHEVRGTLHLHRWCQWLSAYHPNGVYDGEESKRDDYARSLPPFLLNEVLLGHLVKTGGPAVILAEEWQTVDALLHLDWLMTEAGVRSQVAILWNANNTFGFDRIDWARLTRAAVVTTVSRYMKHGMQRLGVDPLVIPNGLSAEALKPPERAAVVEFRARLRPRMVLAKVARWDPDKRWLLAIATVGELRRQGWRPLLIARGGVEAYGREVLRTAALAGLKVVERHAPEPGTRGLFQAIDQNSDADIVCLQSPVDPESRRVLFRGAAAVLANSGHEPFGLVGLETMAAGGVAVTGCSGEDYVIPGLNALVLETDDPREFVSLYHGLRTNPQQERAIRRAGQTTAQHFRWSEITRRTLLPRLRLLRYQQPTAAVA